MGDIRTKFNEVYADGPAFAPTQPDKQLIRDIGGLIEDSITTGQLSIVTAQKLVQKKLCVIDMGFNDGTTNTEIFTGAAGTAQGMTIARVEGVKKFFLRQRISGSGVTEVQRIVQADYSDSGATVVPTIWSEELNIGHQIMSPFVDDGDLYFIVNLPSDPSYPGIDYGKGYSKVKWQGALTSQDDVEGNRVFGYQGSGHPYADMYSVNAAIGADGDTMAFLAIDTKDGDINETAQYLMIFSRAELEANGLNSAPYNGPLPIVPPSGPGLFYRQGLSLSPNGGHVAVLRGYSDAYGRHCVQIFDRFANHVRDVYFEDVRSDYTRAELGNHPTLGFPSQMEPEGTFWDDDGISVLIQESWRQFGAVVTWRGYNYTTRKTDGGGANLGNEPSDADWWQLTDKAATDGEWDATTDYGGPGNYTRRRKVIYRIQVPSGQAGEKSLETGIAQKMPGASVNTGHNARDVSFGKGTVFQISAWIANTGRGLWLNAVAFADNVWRIYDTRNGADNSKYSEVTGSFIGTDEIMELRPRINLDNGSGINLYGNAHVGGVPGGGRAYGDGLVRIQWDRNGQTLLSSDAAYTPLSIDRGDLGKFEEWRVAGSAVGGRWIGNGSPEGSVTAPVGSEYVRLDGGAGTTRYSKETGTGNTGWIAK
ncbi:hypothetical protein [Pararhizobium sp. O133]|uniref:hypothetical protein n=1 Tax=Pararhizobium sp. O133 TaxID=3449278 RepID=UPI003F685E48